MKNGFVFVDELLPGIRWDAKYATWDNFTGKPVDGYEANRIVGTWALCAALERARGKAASGGFGLLLWDLRSIMVDCGFSSYDLEWWHYTLKPEPYPHTYFDFPVS